MTEQVNKVPRLRFRAFNESWKEVSLEKVARFRRGSFPQPYGLPEWFDDNGFPFVQVYDIDKNMKLKPHTKLKISNLAADKSVFIAEGTVIISIQGSIGRVAITQYDAYVDRTVLLFSSFQVPMDKVFFSNVLKRLFAIEKTKAPGGTLKTITKEVLRRFLISIPSFEEQQKIADFLTAVDKRIEQLEEKKRLLTEYKKGVMQQIFSQKIRFTDDHDNPYPDWQEKQLGDVAEIKGGKRLPKGFSLESRDNGYPYITVSDMDNSSVSLDKIKYIPNVIVDKIKNYRIRTTDIYVSVAGTLGLVGMVPKELDNANLTENANKLTNITCNQQYLLELLKSEAFFKLIDSVKTDNAQPKLAIYALKKFKFPLPCQKEQQKIADFLTSIDSKTEQVAAQFEQAKDFKKGLLQQMFV